MPNNFDQSSTGINIECDVWYDHHLAQILHSENFDVIESESYYKTAVYFYTSNNSLPSWKDITFTLKATRQELERYYNNEPLDISAFTLPDYSDTELQELIMEYVGLNICTYFSDTEMFKDYQIEAIPSTPIKRILVRVYSQGVTSYVIYAPELLRDEWGRDDTPCDDEITAPFFNLFYDAPIRGRCEINGEEFTYYECEPKSDYEYERNKWIDHILAHHAAPEGLTREALEAVIPQQPSY